MSSQVYAITEDSLWEYKFVRREVFLRVRRYCRSRQLHRARSRLRFSRSPFFLKHAENWCQSRGSAINFITSIQWRGSFTCALKRARRRSSRNFVTGPLPCVVKTFWAEENTIIGGSATNARTFRKGMWNDSLFDLLTSRRARTAAFCLN